MTIYFGDGSSQTAAGLAGAGKVLQVVSCTKTDAYSTTSEDSWGDIPGTDQNGSGSIWCVKITPASSSNKIWVSAYFQGMGSVNDQTYGRLARGSTGLNIADAAGNRLRAGATGYYNNNISAPVQKFDFLDSPSSTSELTYKAQMYSYNSDTTYINRTGRDSDYSGYDPRFSCTITAMEVSG